MNKKLSLPDVTICAVTSQDPDAALIALQRSSALVGFGAVKLITSHKNLSDDAEIVLINPINSIEDYSHFMMKELHKFIDTDFVLIVQWDGFVVDPLCWDPVFLEYDYIGAPWPQFEPGLDVGNGGFSLRSARLLQCLDDDEVRVHHPEDIGICHVNRRYLVDRYGVKFAPSCVASRFSLERPSRKKPSFGFHGAFNFVAALGDEAPAFLERCKPHMFENRAGYDLVELLLQSDDEILRGHGHRILKGVDLSQASRWRGLRMKLKALLRQAGSGSA